MNDRLIGVAELAAMIGLSPTTIKSDVTRRPHVLPPRVIFPGGRRVLWRLIDVTKWMARLPSGR